MMKLMSHDTPNKVADNHVAQVMNPSPEYIIILIQHLLISQGTKPGNKGYHTSKPINLNKVFFKNQSFPFIYKPPGFKLLTVGSNLL